MSRILLLSMGTPGFVPARRHAGPGLRAAHFAKALARDGHDVLLVAVLAEGERAPEAAAGPAGAGVLFCDERTLFTAGLRGRIEDFAPDGVVGVTAYAASLAARLRLGRPLWADVFGDLMAEAQAKAARQRSDWSLVHFWTLMRDVLEGADRFSAVSGPQADALVGQLGLSGRLSARTAGEELVATIPCAADADPSADATGSSDRDRIRGELGLSASDFVLLISGGVNTWCDVPTLLDGVRAAMIRERRLRLLVTGGAIPGHDEASDAELQRGLATLDPSRLRSLGWVESSRIPGLVAASDLGLHVERPLYERRLGGENRVVEWAARGLACATTALSETGRELLREGIAWRVRPGDAGDLTGVLLAAVAERDADPAAGKDRAARARAWARRERGGDATAAPLLAWCRAPRFAADHGERHLLRVGLLSRPETSVEMLEAYVRALPTSELLRRGLRWVWRRGRDAAAGRLPARPWRPAIGRVLLPALLLLLVVVAAAGCDRAGPSRSAAGRPNVLFVTIDTLRADHLGAYGYKVRPSPSPWIDALAATAHVYERATASAPETAPAVATLMTGTYQDRHGVLYNRRKLAAEQRPLAERFQEAGYATAAFVGNWLLDAERGFGQGFDYFEVVPNRGVGPKTVDDKLVALFGEFARSLPSRPWFAWVHMMDPHGSYDSAPAWWSRGFDYADAPLARDGEVPLSTGNFGLGVLPRYQQLPGEKTLGDYVRRYDGEIRFTDSQVGALLSMLSAAGVAEDTLVVLTADHGESLVEHDELMQHGWFLYEPTVHVPLMLSWPAGLGEAARIGDVDACGVDVAPTVLALAGLESDAADFDGRVLVQRGGQAPGATPQNPTREAGCFSVGARANHLFALRHGPWKMILAPASRPRDPQAPKGTVTTDEEGIELYDLSADPGELHDLSAERPEVAEDMRQAITLLRSRFRANGWRW